MRPYFLSRIASPGGAFASPNVGAAHTVTNLSAGNLAPPLFAPSAAALARLSAQRAPSCCAGDGGGGGGGVCGALLPAALLLLAAAAALGGAPSSLPQQLRGVGSAAGGAGSAAAGASAAPPAAAARFMSAEQLRSVGGASAAAVAFSVPPWAWLSAEAAAAERAAPPPTAAEARAALADPANFRSQDGEDRFAAERLGLARRGRGGLVLETGALDGETFSTSWLFERALGWRAVHVEASAAHFARLVRNRPGALNVHAALCREPATLHIVDGGDGDKKAVGGLLEHMASGFRERIWPGLDAARLPAVACLPLAPLLALFGIAHVDLWVLDVEGAELEVLRAVDFAAVSFGAVVLETDGLDAAKDREAVAVLEAAGYVSLGLVERNTWVVSKEVLASMGASPPG